MVEVSLRTVGGATVVGIGGSSVDAELLGRVVEGAGAFDSDTPLVIDLTSVALHSPSCVREVLEDLAREGVGACVAVVCEGGVAAGWSRRPPAWLHATVGAAVAAVAGVSPSGSTLHR